MGGNHVLDAGVPIRFGVAPNDLFRLLLYSCTDRPFLFRLPLPLTPIPSTLPLPPRSSLSSVRRFDVCG